MNEDLLIRANQLLNKLLDHDLQYGAQTGAAQIVDELIAAATPARKVLTEADALADLAGTPRPSDEAERAMASYTLTIVADSGYECVTEGRCNAKQYGAAIAVLGRLVLS